MTVFWIFTFRSVKLKYPPKSNFATLIMMARGHSETSKETQSTGPKDTK